MKSTGQINVDLTRYRIRPVHKIIFWLMIFSYVKIDNLSDFVGIIRN